MKLAVPFVFVAMALLTLTLGAGSVPAGKTREAQGVADLEARRAMSIGGTGVSFWIEPAEQMVSIFFIQGTGGGMRQDFENAVRQALID